MPISGLDIYKLLPKTNCRECGFATCLAFAMQLAKKAVVLDKCPHVSQEAKIALEASAQPPIKLIAIGSGEDKLEIGNETVMFRHEEKFHRPCGIGFILEDALSDAEIKKKLETINNLKFERVGQQLSVNAVAVRQDGQAARFSQAVKLVIDNTSLPIVLMAKEIPALKAALDLSSQRRPLIYAATKGNIKETGALAKEYKAPLVVSADGLDNLLELTRELNQQGVSDLVLEPQEKSIPVKIWDLTQIRRQALKKANRSLGYPAIVLAQNEDPFAEAQEAATFITKYAGLILLKGTASWEILSLLTLRQNIYTDPQKPLQIEPKMYPVGQPDDKSPVLVTTNFSLTYYTVLGEVEASKVPAYIVSVDTEGMSVLTAWAAEKFTPEKISAALKKFSVQDTVSHKQLVIPGYVAVMSGDLEEQSGYRIIVGPKEASGIPAFLKNLNG
jgi:acetyl-CoA decarbonylase/synthase complex subunit gamma